jgi:hypothetical protein
MNPLEKLRQNIKARYPNENLSESEINEAADRLIKFFTLLVEINAENDKKA